MANKLLSLFLQHTFMHASKYFRFLWISAVNNFTFTDNTAPAKEIQTVVRSGYFFTFTLDSIKYLSKFELNSISELFQKHET